VPARNVVPKPAELSMAQAAVMGMAWLTAYRMLFAKSGLRPGQTMLVQGASGGVATARQRGPKIAQVDLARRLAEAIWHMLTTNRPFAPAGAALSLAS
jgi:D-arabinose 1-dehydrogenase-like Zn-dependent alcohol dehydrogenase